MRARRLRTRRDSPWPRDRIAMRAQYELTKRFGAEDSIRPYIGRDPERVLIFLHIWAPDANAHVRRLASEGTRRRLPWTARTSGGRCILHGAAERGQQSQRLRKMRPDLLIRTAGAWLEQASPERRTLIEHALRSAVKRGDVAALRLLGYGVPAAYLITRRRTNARFNRLIGGPR